MIQSKFSCHIQTWNKHTWYKAINDIAETEYSGFEGAAGFMAKFQHRSEMGKAFLQKRDLVLSALTSCGDLIVPEEREAILKQALEIADFLSSLGVQILVMETGTRRLLGDMRHDFHSMARTLDELGKRCMDRGIHLCVLPQRGQRVESAEEIDRLMNRVDTNDVFLCPDTGDLQLVGEQPDEIINIYGACIRHLYLTDCIPPDEPVEGSHFCELGEGIVNLDHIVSTLDDLNYSGWIVSRLDESRRTPLESAQCSLQYLHSTIKSDTKTLLEPNDE